MVPLKLITYGVVLYVRQRRKKLDIRKKQGLKYNLILQPVLHTEDKKGQHSFYSAIDNAFIYALSLFITFFITFFPNSIVLYIISYISKWGFHIVRIRLMVSSLFMFIATSL